MYIIYFPSLFQTDCRFEKNDIKAMAAGSRKGLPEAMELQGLLEEESERRSGEAMGLQ